MSVAHLLNRTLQHWRLTSVPDGAGGQQVTPVHLGALRARVSQPTDTERLVAAQGGTDLDAKVHASPDADIRRGDELRDGPEVLEVLAVLVPSKPIYTRADCRIRQTEGS